LGEKYMVECRKYERNMVGKKKADYS